MARRIRLRQLMQSDFQASMSIVRFAAASVTICRKRRRRRSRPRSLMLTRWHEQDRSSRRLRAQSTEFRGPLVADLSGHSSISVGGSLAMATGCVERRLAAVLAADVAGYSRLMGVDEVGTLAVLKAVRGELVDPEIAEHKGRIVKTTGDGMLVEFASSVDAVTCAIAIQRRMAERAASTADSQLRYRIGINIGDIIIDADDIFGDGVNIAARLEGIAEPGGVCISSSAYEQVRGKVNADFVDLGVLSLKNICRPTRAYAVSPRESPVRQASIPVSAPRLSVVVLPFTNFGGDPAHEHFVDGLTESLTTDLSRINGSLVIARNTAFTFKGKAVDVRP